MLKSKSHTGLDGKTLLKNGIIVSILASVGGLNSLGMLGTRKHTSNALDFYN